MAEKKYPPMTLITGILAALVILVGILLVAGCTGTHPGTPDTGTTTAVPQGTSGILAAEDCSFDLLTGNPDSHLARGDSCYFRNHTPIEYLNDLRMHPQNMVVVIDVPDDWITLHDAELLMQEIDSVEPAAPVVSPVSSYRPFNQSSTVGNEALFLLEGYRAAKYPPALCSLHYFRPDRKEMRTWWDTYGKLGLPDERDAVRISQQTYPELRAYPSGDLPPKSIRTTRAPGGWYVAFIQEGSGLPILSARCYFVGDDRNVSLTGVASRGSTVLPQDLSPLMCG
jgi:hypothetical protein